jgi:uncharacterized phage protein gp47/JayE
MLSSQGFSATDWETDSDGRVILQVEAQTLEDLWQAVYNIAKGGYLDTATGEWLTLLARSQYEIERNPATYTVGSFTLSAIPGVGPYTFNAGDLVVTTFDGNGNALVYRSTNAVPVVVNPGASIGIQVTADSPGSRFNIPAGSTLVNNTPRPGLFVTNPGTLQPAFAIGAVLNGPFFTRNQTFIISASINGGAPIGPISYTFPASYPNMAAVAGALNALIAAEGSLNGKVIANTANGALVLNTIDPAGATIIDTLTISRTGTANITLGFDKTLDTSASGSYAWITTYGQDEESDPSLVQRCQNKWATIGAGTRAAFISWATTADAAVQKVAVYSNLFNGTPKAGAVTLYIAGIGVFTPAEGIIHSGNVYNYIAPKLPIMTELYVTAATRQNVEVGFTATIKTANNNDQTKAAVINAIQQLFNDLSIGDTIYYDQVVAAIITVPGIVDANVTLNGAKVNITPSINQICSLSIPNPPVYIVVS